ncbi:MAG: hypothetical protein KYX63_08095 [Alteromonas macleodii]|nr:hypothetical protein [Alteromonas macleodii]
MEVQARKHGSSWVNSLIAITVLLAAITFLMVLTFKHLVAPSDLAVYSKSDLGTFGDFLGGILNPILSTLTIVLLVWSIRVQLNELKISREQHKFAIDQGKETLEQLVSSQKREKALVNAQQLNLLLPRAKEELTKHLDDLQNSHTKTIELRFEIKKEKLHVRVVEYTYCDLLYRATFILKMHKPLVYSEDNNDPVFQFIHEIQTYIHRACYCINEMQKLDTPSFFYEKEARKLRLVANQLKYISKPTNNMDILETTIKRIEKIRERAFKIDPSVSI